MYMCYILYYMQVWVKRAVKNTISYIYVCIEFNARVLEKRIQNQLFSNFDVKKQKAKYRYKNSRVR